MFKTVTNNSTKSLGDISIVISSYILNTSNTSPAFQRTNDKKNNQ